LAIPTLCSTISSAPSRRHAHAQGGAGPELDDLAQDALNALGDPFGESRDDPSSVSRAPFDRPALLEEDLFLGEGPASRSAEAAPVAPKTPQEKRPAVLKIAYASAFAFGREYRKNLAEGSTFVASAKPLSEGRPCVFEITLPGFDLLTLHGEVAWSSKGRTLSAGEQVGMRIGYRLTPQERLALETLLNRIGV
jgi:Tfp pilus assembly protein PilZ